MPLWHEFVYFLSDLLHKLKHGYAGTSWVLCGCSVQLISTCLTSVVKDSFSRSTMCEQTGSATPTQWSTRSQCKCIPKGSQLDEPSKQNIDDLNVDSCHLSCYCFEWTAGHPKSQRKWLNLVGEQEVRHKSNQLLPKAVTLAGAYSLICSWGNLGRIIVKLQAGHTVKLQHSNYCTVQNLVSLIVSSYCGSHYRVKK